MSPREHRYVCRLDWTGASRGPTTSYEAYSREYSVVFEGKPPIVGSADPSFRGDPRLHNPEDLLMAALSACHCLTYLALCARARIGVARYEDEAVGTMAAVGGGMQFTEVILRPRVRLVAAGDVEAARALHREAHETCFIARSVNFPVRHEPEVTG